MKNPYGFFDEIVCINLRCRKDKRKYAENIFKKLDIPAKFYIANKSSFGGCYGCFESHINVIKQAYKNGSKNILIFEDDVMPSMYYSKNIIAKCVDFMKSDYNWDFFYLGYSALNLRDILYPEKITKDIHKGKILGLHAYVVNRKIMKDVIEKADYFLKNPKELGHIDMFLLKNYKLQYIAKNQFIQNKCLGTNNKYNLLNFNINNIVDKLFCFFHTKLQLDTFVKYHGEYIKLLIFILILILVIKYNIIKNKLIR